MKDMILATIVVAVLVMNLAACGMVNLKPSAQDEQGKVERKSSPILSSGKKEKETGNQKGPDMGQTTNDAAPAPLGKPEKSGYPKISAKGEEQAVPSMQQVKEWVEVSPEKENLSTFSIDVDTGSYTYSRQTINSGMLPVPDSVRIEEFINYFEYEYTAPTGDEPFAVDMELTPAPKEDLHYLRVGIQGRKPEEADLGKARNLVFLIDVSGSMNVNDGMEMVRNSILLLIPELTEQDSVALVTYASSTEVLFPSTPMNSENRKVLMKVVENLRANGGTNMGSGMKLAYDEALKAHSNKKSSRVIVCSDGDANIGMVSHEDILKEIAGYEEEGIFMTTLGFGRGNYQDEMMEQLANKGNGNYYFIDSIPEARRVLKQKMHGTFDVIAKDVKLQMEFDPAMVESYKLVGYDNRVLDNQDFEDDTKDAGEIGLGHQVTAIYALKLKTGFEDKKIKLAIRYKKPDESESTLKTFSLAGSEVNTSMADSSRSFQFAWNVALFAMKLQQNPLAEDVTWEAIHQGLEINGNDQLKEQLAVLDLIEQVQKIEPLLVK